MNLYQSILKITTALVVIFVFTSCDDDFSEVGGELIENPAGVQLEKFDVKTFTSKLNSVQTNYYNTNLVSSGGANQNTYYGSKLLGVYTNNVYGEDVASVVSGLQLSTTNPDFPADTNLDSVVLEIPYFSKQEASNTTSVSYKLDSLYGETPIKLSIFESKYYLSDLDPESNFEDSQKYYSNQQDIFENHKGEKVYENTSFYPSSKQIILLAKNSEGENDTIVRKPALRVKLDKEFFKEKIINNQSKLSSQADFDNYFRGLYLKAEPVSDKGNMVLLDMANADANTGITLYYSHDNDEGEKVSKSFKINFDTKKINLLKGNYPENILSEIAAQDTLVGAEKLYLKGGEGSMGVIKLFPDNQVLEDLRARDLIINEANLTFYVPNDIDFGVEPSRIYLYDLDKKSIIADASSASFSASPATSASTIFGPLQDEEDGYKSYKLRLTSHIVNLLASEDVKNVRLGLVVVSNINSVLVSNRGQITALNNTIVKESTPSPVKAIPSVSVISPKGTVLYGNTAEDEARRPKLNIYYTESGI
ncbi:DUF4270 domain-containing protein [Zunongwangia sp.]|uniref:DUF4270 domain-containing protein n=1 Tax=Zunongwangia sp. TaxID=1965325 RepID=UPI003AA94FA7